MKLQRSFNRNTFHFYHSTAPGALLVHHETPHLDTPPEILLAGLPAIAKTREAKHKKIHLSDAIRGGVAPGEKLVGIARIHFIYMVYSVIIASVIWGLSLAIGHQFRAVSDDMLRYLGDHQTSGAIDFNQLAQIFYFLGYSGLGQICSVLGLEELSGLSSPVEYERLWRFFAGMWWRWGGELSLQGLSILYFIFRVLELKAIEIVITNTNLLYKRGIFIVRTLKINLNQIERADVNQTWLGSLLGYGFIHIYTHAWQTQGEGLNEHLGTAAVFLPAIAAPHKFTALIDRHKETLK